jgi:hypothetical protein
MTNERPEPATEPRPTDTVDTTADIQPASHPIKADISLASYVEVITPDDFTVPAKATISSEIKAFATELCDKTKAYQHLDEEAENALRKHVIEASRSMRLTKQGKDSKVSDWCKWIGFAFLGFTVQQFSRVSGEKVILRGSVNWLVAEVIITMVLLAIGFAIDKPLDAVTRVFRKKM